MDPVSSIFSTSAGRTVQHFDPFRTPYRAGTVFSGSVRYERGQHRTDYGTATGCRSFDKADSYLESLCIGARIGSTLCDETRAGAGLASVLLRDSSSVPGARSRRCGARSDVDEFEGWRRSFPASRLEEVPRSALNQIRRWRVTFTLKGIPKGFFLNILDAFSLLLDRLLR